MIKFFMGKRKLFSILFLTLFIFTIIIIPSSTQAYPNAPINLSRQTDKAQYSLETDNGHFTVNYTIQPQPIPVSAVNVNYSADRDVVLVMDTSGSMGDQLGNTGKTKLQVLKDTASNFISKFNGDSRVNISLVTYSNTANVMQFKDSRGNILKDSNNQPIIFANMSNSTQTNALLSNFSPNGGLSANGGTNIGDGLRRAYWLLKKSPRTNSRKYVILMTDGMPTAYTYDYYYDYYGYYKTYYTGDGSADSHEVYVNSGNYDNNNNSLNYAQTIGGLIKSDSLKISSTMVAFSNDADRSKLSQIAQSAGGDYKVALSDTDMAAVYNNIAGQINSDLPISPVDFQETLPDGVQVDPAKLPTGFMVSGQTITGSLNGIPYKLDSTKRYYVAGPITFSIGMSASAIGTYILGQNHTAFLTYTDIDGNTTKNYFPELTVNIYRTSPPDIVASITEKPGCPGVYTLTIVSGKDPVNDSVLINVTNTKTTSSTTKTWTSDGRKTNINTYTFDINASDLVENSLYIKATDKSNNVSTETVPLIKLGNPVMSDYDHSDNQRPGDLTLTTEPNTNITSIIINGRTVGTNVVTDSNGNYKLQGAMLNDGNNTINIQASNQYKNTANMSFVKNVDAASPVITPVFNDDCSAFNATFNEPVNQAWYQCDFNGDGTIDSTEKVSIPISGSVTSVQNISVSGAFYNQTITIKARDLNGNIGTATLTPSLKSKIIKQGIFAEVNNTGGIDGTGYLAQNADGSVSTANFVLTKLGAVIKMERANSPITIEINKYNSSLSGNISNITVQLYKVNDTDGSLTKIDSNSQITDVSNTQKKITITPSTPYVINANYIITYTVKANISNSSLGQNGVNMINRITVDGSFDELKLNDMPLPDIG